jgi:hypothetical protein
MTSPAAMVSVVKELDVVRAVRKRRLLPPYVFRIASLVQRYAKWLKIFLDVAA